MFVGNKDNTIYNVRDETIGYYQDIVAQYIDVIDSMLRDYKHEIIEALKKGDMKDAINILNAIKIDEFEDVEQYLEELEEINEYKDSDGLLVLSENNGMGFTCKEYKGAKDE